MASMIALWSLLDATTSSLIVVVVVVVSIGRIFTRDGRTDGHNLLQRCVVASRKILLRTLDFSTSLGLSKLDWWQSWLLTFQPNHVNLQAQIFFTSLLIFATTVIL